MSSSNSVSVTYTYNNSSNSNTVSGNFTQNGDGYIANLADQNFPAVETGTDNVILIGGIIIQLTTESNNDITINEVAFLQQDLDLSDPLPTTSPATNVTFNVNINNKKINYTATFSSVLLNSILPKAYIMYMYSSSQQQDSFFSQAALTAGTKAATLTTSFLRRLDPTGSNITDEEAGEIGKSAGKAFSHTVSATEWAGDALNRIGTAIAKK
jgi:hypothetical protein